MSWSIAIIGKAENVVKALDEQSEKLSGQSKIEYDDVLPHMKAIVSQNFGNENVCISVSASGHGYAVDGEQKNRTASVRIENIYGVLV